MPAIEGFNFVYYPSSALKLVLSGSERLAKIINPLTPRFMDALRDYVIITTELSDLMDDLPNHHEVKAAEEDLVRLTQRLIHVTNEIGRLGTLRQRLFSIKKLKLIAAMGKGLPMIRDPLIILQNEVANLWARQSVEACRTIAERTRLVAEQKALSPYYRAAVEALLGQYVDVASAKVETSQACLLSANRLIHGSQSLTSGWNDENAATGETEDSKGIGVRKRLMDLLQYPSMGVRQRNVSTPRDSSCEWVFKESADTTGDSLRSWLRRGSSLYVIAGEPGSGKSTLMRHIWDTRAENLQLDEWAKGDGCVLLSAAFFFWRNGSRLERSAEGLWRALLLQALIQSPDLLPSVFPKDWALLYVGATVPPAGSWTVAELQEALQRLATQMQAPAKLFLLIDGLDEHEEHHAGGHQTQEQRVAETRTPESERRDNESGYLACLEFLVNKLCPLDNVRVVLSSRPSRIMDRMGLHPSAYVQNHNQEDIASYVAGTLIPDGTIWTRSNNGIDRDTVRETILDASQGVYLAAMLCVQYTNRALTKGSSIESINIQLQRGRDLKDFYHLIWHTLDQDVRTEALRVMGVMLNREGIYHSLHRGERPPRLIDIALALGEDPKLERPWQAAQPLVERKCARIAQSFMEAWPGFIKISAWEGQDESANNANGTFFQVSSASAIDYCHRSVPEFFRAHAATKR
ncbi:uncharacterized protein B0I36DRAFT_361159 [Microdochium trichocladiopsis]|uniref:Nephrocystin 3-like N-terminal domain-containing protein n=1 Tax=Microdochium trichocladiopsis TaxID=1682393 RepID=A0A9P9BRE7_9PEZI|nr:uncharacterized protein B0I36DRAFT_361159 [Microdochium trichocladiopsis]KAH7035833.1 hypothetical protein B0I36DRAFT_361159 [Microdochium trichocladiopsis]